MNPVSIALDYPTKTAANEPDHHTSQLTKAMVGLDESAYREFFKLYYKRLYSYLTAIAGGDRQHVEDALQSAFPKIVKHIKVFDSDAAFWNWISLISRNTLFDIYRKEGTQLRTVTAFSQDSALAPYAAHTVPPLRLQKLEQSLNQLPDDQRFLIRSKYIEGLTYSEIADITHTTEKSVESKLSRIRKKLRTLIGKDPHHG